MEVSWVSGESIGKMEQENLYCCLQITSSQSDYNISSLNKMSKSQNKRDIIQHDRCMVRQIFCTLPQLIFVQPIFLSHSYVRLGGVAILNVKVMLLVGLLINSYIRLQGRKRKKCKYFCIGQTNINVHCNMFVQPHLQAFAVMSNT